MQFTMMVAAECDEVVEFGFAAIGPVFYVVAFCVAGFAAAWKLAAVVSYG